MNSAKVRRYPDLLNWTCSSTKWLYVKLEYTGTSSVNTIREWKLQKCSICQIIHIMPQLSHPSASPSDADTESHYTDAPMTYSLNPFLGNTTIFLNQCLVWTINPAFPLPIPIVKVVTNPAISQPSVFPESYYTDE